MCCSLMELIIEIMKLCILPSSATLGVQNFPKDVGTSLNNAFLNALMEGIWKLICIDSDLND